MDGGAERLRSWNEGAEGDGRTLPEDEDALHAAAIALLWSSRRASSESIVCGWLQLANQKSALYLYDVRLWGLIELSPCSVGPSPAPEGATSGPKGKCI